MIDFCDDIVLTKPSAVGGIAIGDSATGYLPAYQLLFLLGISAGNVSITFRTFSIAIGIKVLEIQINSSNNSIAIGTNASWIGNPRGPIYCHCV